MVQHTKPGRTRAELLRYDHSGTRWRHQRGIRTHLVITPWDAAARHLVATIMRHTVDRREAVADLVNVAIEELVRQRRELPPFGVLWRTARRIQTRHQHALYRQVATRLSPQDRERLAPLFEVVSTSHWSPWQQAKSDPGPPTARRFQAVWAHLQWLESWPLPDGILADITRAQRQQWATEAQSLDASRMLALAEDKRWALTVAFLVGRAVQTRDDLAEMLVKRMQRLHKRAREALLDYQQRQRDQADHLITVFHQVLAAYQRAKTPATQAQAVADVLGDDAAHLQDQCDAHLAQAGHNYYGFLPPLFRSQRATCFRLLQSLTIEATTQDEGLVHALRWLKTQAIRVTPSVKWCLYTMILPESGPFLLF